MAEAEVLSVADWVDWGAAVEDSTVEEAPPWMGSMPLVASSSHELTVVDALAHADEEELAGASVAVKTPLESVLASARDVGRALSAEETVSVGTIWEDSADWVNQGYECCPPWPEVHAVLSAGAAVATGSVVEGSGDAVIQGYECCPPCPEVQAVLSAGWAEETTAEDAL